MHGRSRTNPGLCLPNDAEPVPFTLLVTASRLQNRAVPPIVCGTGKPASRDQMSKHALNSNVAPGDHAILRRSSMTPVALLLASHTRSACLLACVLARGHI